MRKAVIIGAVVLLVGTATAVWANTDASDSDAESGDRTWGHRFGSGLSDVLAELVEDQTITSAQADAIIAAVESKRAEFVAARAEMKELLATFWEDEVLTAEEIAQLPNAERFTAEDSPFADALADGEITKDELAEKKGRAWGGRRSRGGDHGGHRDLFRT